MTTPDEFPNGILALTFDDSRCAEWLAQLPRFGKYGARATFFFHKEIDAEKLDAMRALKAAGHSIGLHALHHLDAVPALEEMGAERYIAQEIAPQLAAMADAGLATRNFAYPNNRRNAATDAALGALFRRFRAGLPVPRPLGTPVTERPDALIPLAEVATRRVLGGAGIGEFYSTRLPDLMAELEAAARTRSLLVFFSHGISTQPNPIDMHEDILEALLQKAASLGIAILGFDDLPDGDD